MDIKIGKCIYLTGIPTHVKNFIMSTYTIDNPVFVKAKQAKRPTWGLERKIYLYSAYGDTISLGRGTLNDISEILERFHVKDYTYSDERFVHSPISFGDLQNMVLRKYQSEAVNAMLNEEFGIVEAPAGSGKTVIGLELIRRLRQPTLWLVHTEELIKQTANRAYKILSNVGRIGYLYNKEKSIGDGKLIIASVKTLAQNPDLITMLNKYIGCIVLDEAHHAPANTFNEVLTQLSARYIFGLTATPYRADGLQPLMHAMLGPVRKTVTRQELYDSGHLLKPKVVPIYTQFEYSAAAEMHNGAVDAGGDGFDYHEVLEALYKDEERLQVVAKNIAKNITGNYQLVLADNKAYLSKLFNAVTSLLSAEDRVEPMAILTADLNAKDRDSTMNAFISKRLKVVFATQLAREGLDIDHLNIVHITAARRGDRYIKGGVELGSALEQEVGRVMRPDPNNPNKRSIIFDYVDYETGVLKSQYRSRCMVYKRLLLDVPRKPSVRDEEDLSKIFKSMPGVIR